MDSLEKEFVPYNPALRLKALGFNEPCLAVFNQEENLYICHSDSFELEDTFYSQQAIEEIGYKCLAPTFSQCFRWFREKGYDVKVQKESDGLYFGFYWTGAAWIIVGNGSHEEAELDCLIKLIEIVESKTE